MTSIFVAKLDFGVTNEELTAVFEEYGKVKKATVATDKETGKPRGFAFVEMFDDNEAQEAIKNLDGYKFNGRPCVVKQAEDRGGGQSSPKREFTPRPQGTEKKPFNSRSEEFPKREEDSDSSTFPTSFQGGIDKKPIVKLKKKENKPNDNEGVDGKAKKPKMNAYKKSGKGNQFYSDDEDLDDELDLFGFGEEDEEDEDYSKYVVNSDEDYEDEDWDEEDEEDEDY